MNKSRLFDVLHKLYVPGAILVSGMPGIIKTFTHPVLAMFILAGTPTLSNAYTLVFETDIHDNDYVTGILGLDINGTTYDVTLYNDTVFDVLWDADGDGVFGESDGSIYNSQPTFWGDQPAANDAATAIMAALGTDQATKPDLVGTGGKLDLFKVPYEFVDTDTVRSHSDSNGALTLDFVNILTSDTDFIGQQKYNPYAAFEAAVPLPAAVWLFGSGLLGLIGISRRKKA